MSDFVCSFPYIKHRTLLALNNHLLQPRTQWFPMTHKTAITSTRFSEIILPTFFFMCLPRQEKIPPCDSPTLIWRKEIAQTICNFQKLQESSFCTFLQNPYLSSKSKKDISGVRIGCTLRETDSEIVSSTPSKVYEYTVQSIQQLPDPQ